MRAHTDASIDGKNVKYQSDTTQKRKRPSIDKLLTPTKIIKQDNDENLSIPHNDNDTEGWGKFYNVFL
jgi:regulatory protein YycH of two-component signal transduction system YycFG